MINLKQFASCAYSTYGMIQKTHDLAQDLVQNKIQGDFVECGVAVGAQVGVMAAVCKQHNDSRPIHLYDSFEGIPLAGPKDTVQPGIGKISHDVNVGSRNLLKSSGITSHSLESVKQHMKKWQVHDMNLVYHKGWFQDTIPNNTIDKIAFLRLDGDLYESTKICLDYLGPKVVKGGYVVIDDYALDGARLAVDEFIKENNLNVNLIKIYEGVEGGKTHDDQLAPVYWKM